MIKVPCVCVNSKKKPECIPYNQWINEGTEYHIVHVYYYPKQGIQGVLLQEVRLTTTREQPYDSYALNRFAFKPEDIYTLINLMKECTELNEVDIKKLLEESNVELV